VAEWVYVWRKRRRRGRRSDQESSTKEYGCRDQSRRRNEHREEHVYYCVADLEMEVALS
jgi:hypothetical protein